MHSSVLLSAGIVAIAASFAPAIDDPAPQVRQAQTVEVHVRIECLAGRGASFSLVPWSITVYPTDSVAWLLDPQSNVGDMDILETRGQGWPFRVKTPYKGTKVRPAGAKGFDAQQKAGKYKYSVRALCVRTAAATDTILIDPDMIIPRGGGT